MWKALLLYRLWRGLTEQYRGDTQRWLNYTLLEPQILKTIAITHLFLTFWYMVQALIARLWLLQGDFQDCTAVRNTLQLWVTWLQQLSLVCGSSLWHQRIAVVVFCSLYCFFSSAYKQYGLPIKCSDFWTIIALHVTAGRAVRLQWEAAGSKREPAWPHWKGPYVMLCSVVPNSSLTITSSFWLLSSFGRRFPVGFVVHIVYYNLKTRTNSGRWMMILTVAMHKQALLVQPARDSLMEPWDQDLG